MERGLQRIRHGPSLERGEKKLVKGAPYVGAHRIVSVDVAEVDHLLFEVDTVAGQCLFRRFDFDFAQMRPPAIAATTDALDWSTPSRLAKN